MGWVGCIALMDLLRNGSILDEFPMRLGPHHDGSMYQGPTTRHHVTAVDFPEENHDIFQVERQVLIEARLHETRTEVIDNHLGGRRDLGELRHIRCHCELGVRVPTHAAEGGLVVEELQERLLGVVVQERRQGLGPGGRVQVQGGTGEGDPGGRSALGSSCAEEGQELEGNQDVCVAIYCVLLLSQAVSSSGVVRLVP